LGGLKTGLFKVACHVLILPEVAMPEILPTINGRAMQIANDKMSDFFIYNDLFLQKYNIKVDVLNNLGFFRMNDT
jgi:hypothetical protein